MPVQEFTEAVTLTCVIVNTLCEVAVALPAIKHLFSAIKKRVRK